MLRLDIAVLVGIIMQSFFYGVFQVLFVGCLYVLVSGRFERINWHFFNAAIVMWVLITLNFALSWSRIMDGFIFLQPAFRKDPDAIDKYFSSLNHWKEVTRTAFYVALTAVADSLFIYRLYVVWGRNRYIIILPVVLLCGSITSGIGIEIVIGTSSSGLFGSKLAVWATSFFSISLVQNVLTTLLIVYRIWRVNVEVSRNLGAQSLWPVISVLLESGAIYSTTLLILLCTYAAGSFAQYIALDMLVPIIGITFNLIIVRIGLGISHGGSTTRKAPSQTSALAFPLRKLNINVTRNVTTNRDIEQGHSNSGAKIHHSAESDTLDDTTAWKSVPEEI